MRERHTRKGYTILVEPDDGLQGAWDDTRTPEGPATIQLFATREEATTYAKNYLDYTMGPEWTVTYIVVTLDESQEPNNV